MYHSTMRSNVGGCSVSLSLNLNLNINLSLSVAPDASGGPCSNTCCGRSDCGIGSYSSNGSYSSSRNGGCSSNDRVLCVRAAAPGPLRQCSPSRTAFFLLCARASASAAGAGTDHSHDSPATVAEDSQATVADVTAEDSQATAAADSQTTVADVDAEDSQATVAEDSQATVAEDSQAKAAGVSAKDALDSLETMAGVFLPSFSTQRRSCSRSPSSRGSSPILLSMFSTHAAGLQSLSLVRQDQTSQHLATSLPSSVFVGGATGGGVHGASGGLHSLHGFVSAPNLVHGGKGVDSAHARLHRPVLPDVGSSMSSVPASVRWPALSLTAAAPVGFRTKNYLPAASPASASATASVSSAASSTAASPAVSLAASPAQGAIAAAIAGSNLLLLAQDCAYLAQVNAQLLADVPYNRRDALDLAGKLPLAIKALSVGIPLAELNIDPSQAGGLLGKFDAMITRVALGRPASHGGVEIKGARSYRGDLTFQFSRLRASTPFEHLLFVARRRDPADWTDLRELDACFWLGHVARADFDAALATKVQKAPQASGHNAEQRASITIGSRRQSWLGACVKWVSFGALDKAWWDTHVTGRMSAGHARQGVSGGGVSSGQGRLARIAVGAMP